MRTRRGPWRGSSGKDPSLHCEQTERGRRRKQPSSRTDSAACDSEFRGACVSQKLLRTEHTFDLFTVNCSKRGLGSRGASGKRSSGWWEVRVCQEQRFYFTSFSVTEYLWSFKRAEMIYSNSRISFYHHHLLEISSWTRRFIHSLPVLLLKVEA